MLDRFLLCKNQHDRSCYADKIIPIFIFFLPWKCLEMGKKKVSDFVKVASLKSGSTSKRVVCCCTMEKYLTLLSV